jgi:rhamnosyltransferase subunit B
MLSTVPGGATCAPNQRSSEARIDAWSDRDASRAKPVALLGWELGAGLGHAGRLLCIVRALRLAGFTTIVAARQPELFAAEPGLTTLPAPCHPGAFPAGFIAASYADVLACSGFSNAASLSALMDGWQEIFERVQPSIIVTDFAPSLCLTARGQFPVVAAETGYSLPPTPGGVFPRMSEHGSSTNANAHVLETIQETLGGKGRQPLRSLSDLLETEASFVTCLPELDPYASMRGEAAVGPVEPMASMATTATQKFFAYLSMEMPGCQDVLVTLAQSGFQGRAFVRGADDALRQRMGAMGLEILTRPESIEKIVSESYVVVHHGSLAMAHHALAAGRPQLVFPGHLEQFLTSRRLAGLGVAHVLSGSFLGNHVVEAMRQLMIDSAFKERARLAALSIHARGPWDALGKIVGRCQQLAQCEVI